MWLQFAWCCSESWRFSLPGLIRLISYSLVQTPDSAVISCHWYCIYYFRYFNRKFHSCVTIITQSWLMVAPQLIFRLAFMLSLTLNYFFLALALIISLFVPRSYNFSISLFVCTIFSLSVIIPSFLFLSLTPSGAIYHAPSLSFSLSLPPLSFSLLLSLPLSFSLCLSHYFSLFIVFFTHRLFSDVVICQSCQQRLKMSFT